MISTMASFIVRPDLREGNVEFLWIKFSVDKVISSETPSGTCITIDVTKVNFKPILFVLLCTYYG